MRLVFPPMNNPPTVPVNLANSSTLVTLTSPSTISTTTISSAPSMVSISAAPGTSVAATGQDGNCETS